MHLFRDTYYIHSRELCYLSFVCIMIQFSNYLFLKRLTIHPSICAIIEENIGVDACDACQRFMPNGWMTKHHWPTHIYNAENEPVLLVVNSCEAHVSEGSHKIVVNECNSKSLFTLAF